MRGLWAAETSSVVWIEADVLVAWQWTLASSSDGRYRICIFVLAVFILLVLLSSILGVFLSIGALHSLGDSLMHAVYVLAVVAFA